uniref:Putative secreted protein n=1 Tax=Anopheles marajoara TaxID=58244 RepID=A0A2M4C8N0_9DIPT
MRLLLFLLLLLLLLRAAQHSRCADGHKIMGAARRTGPQQPESLVFRPLLCSSANGAAAALRPGQAACVSYPSCASVFTTRVRRCRVIAAQHTGIREKGVN